MSLTLVVIWSGWSRSDCRKIFPSRVIARSTASSLSASFISRVLAALAIFTLVPCCNIGVITMKMIKSTSMTSTMGVTLISETAPSDWVFFGILLLPALGALDEIVDQFGRGIVHLDIERFDLGGEVVVNPHGRDGDEQTESGGDESFGNSACDRAQSGCFAVGNSFECVDDAQHGAEQSHEGSRGTDGGQGGDAALQFCVHDGGSPFQGAFGRFNGLA